MHNSGFIYHVVCMIIQRLTLSNLFQTSNANMQKTLNSINNLISIFDPTIDLTYFTDNPEQFDQLSLKCIKQSGFNLSIICPFIFKISQSFPPNTQISILHYHTSNNNNNYQFINNNFIYYSI